MSKLSLGFAGAAALAAVCLLPHTASAQYYGGWGGPGFSLYIGPPYGYYGQPPYGYYGYPRYYRPYAYYPRYRYRPYRKYRSRPYW
jgi:hypothetical protein